MANEHLIGHLKEDVGVLRNPRLEKAFLAVDRKYFVPEKLQDEAYGDYPLPIGFGATISQPTTVVFMLEKLDVRPGQKVLDIGSGSGWTTALLSYLVGPKGKVIALEIVPELVALGHQNLTRWYADVLKNNRIPEARAEIRQAKKNIVGFPEEAPFDRILVSAAGKEIPEGLVEQLTPAGILVIPVHPHTNIGSKVGVDVNQSIFRIHKKSGGGLKTEKYPGFIFVPLQ